MSTIARIASLFLLFLMCARVSVSGETKRRAVRRNPPTAGIAAAHYRGGPARTGVYDTAGPRTFSAQKWRTQAASSSYSAPVYADGTLYFNDGTGREVALNAETGAMRWRTPVLSSIISAPTVTTGAIYIGV